MKHNALLYTSRNHIDGNATAVLAIQEFPVTHNMARDYELNMHHITFAMKFLQKENDKRQ